MDGRYARQKSPVPSEGRRLKPHPPLSPRPPSPPPPAQGSRQQFVWDNIYGQPANPASGQLGQYLPPPQPADKPAADSGYGTASHRQTVPSQYPGNSSYQEPVQVPYPYYYGGPYSYTPYPSGSFYPYGYAAVSGYPTAQQADADPKSHVPVIINNNVFRAGPDDESSSDEKPQNTSKQSVRPRSDDEAGDYVPYPRVPPPAAASLNTDNKAKNQPQIIINNNIYDPQEPDSDSVSDVEVAVKRRDRRPRSAMQRPPNKNKVVFQESEKPLTFRLNPLAPQDITVHMSLDTTDDLGGTLEEHSKLRRLGHFDAAFTHFDNHLEHFLDNKYVVVQYGQCLLEAKRYRQLADLARDNPPKPSVETLQLSWNVLLKKAEVESALEFPGLEDTSMLVEHAYDLVRPGWPHLDSTEMQILVHSIGLYDEFVTWIDSDEWRQLYDYLLAEGLIWEFRDLLLELEQVRGAEEALGLLIDLDAPESSVEAFVDRLHDDWDADDESSLYALLDIFSALALAFMGKTEHESIRTKCLDIAENYDILIVGDIEERSRCRPCLRFMMAFALINDHGAPGARDGIISFPDERRGDLLLSRHLFPSESLPIYAPAEDEVPSWRPRQVSDSRGDTQTLTLKTEYVFAVAKQLGDIETQAACLQELMYQGQQDAEVALKQLEGIWSAVGGMAKVQQTQLFRYMVAKSPEDREQLRRDILMGGEFAFAGFWEGYAQYMILRALSPKTREKEHYLTRAKAMKTSIRQLQEERSSSRQQRVSVADEGTGGGGKQVVKAASYNDWRKDKLGQISSGLPKGRGSRKNGKDKHLAKKADRGDQTRKQSRVSDDDEDEDEDEDEDKDIEIYIRRQIVRNQKETKRLRRHTAKENEATERLKNETIRLRRARQSASGPEVLRTRDSKKKSTAKHFEETGDSSYDSEGGESKKKPIIIRAGRTVNVFTDDDEDSENRTDDNHRKSRVDDYEGSSDADKNRFKGTQPETVPERVPGQLRISLPGYDANSDELVEVLDEDGTERYASTVEGQGSFVRSDTGSKSRSSSSNRSRGSSTKTHPGSGR